MGDSHPATSVPFAYYDLGELFVRLLKVLFAVGSGELAMGAMWFLYSLLYAFVGMVFLYYVISIFQKDPRKRYHFMTIVLFIIASVSCVLSQNFAITISRFSISATAMFLIWWGMIINRKWQWKYDQGWACLLAFFIFVHCILRYNDEMVLAHNQYYSLPYLVIGCTSAIYGWGYISKKIEGNWIGKALALLGRESLYLMDFHIIGFFICNSLMVYWGIFTMDSPKGLYTFKLGDNGWLLLAYVAFGVIVPLVIMYVFRKIKRVFI